MLPCWWIHRIQHTKRFFVTSQVICGPDLSSFSVNMRNKNSMCLSGFFNQILNHKLKPHDQFVLHNYSFICNCRRFGTSSRLYWVSQYQIKDNAIMINGHHIFLLNLVSLIVESPTWCYFYYEFIIKSVRFLFFNEVKWVVSRGNTNIDCKVFLKSRYKDIYMYNALAAVSLTAPDTHSGFSLISGWDL